MFPLLTLMLKNLGRNRVRALLTSLAIVVLVAVFAFVSSITRTIRQVVESHSSQTRLIVREKWVAPSEFPVRYASMIARLEGVDDWTVWHYFAGRTHTGAPEAIGFATRLENLREMHPGLERLSGNVLREMKRYKSGAVVGRLLMHRMGWSVGQTVSLRSLTRDRELSFRIVAVIPGDAWSQNFFFREDYFQDACNARQTVNAMWLRVRSPEVGNRVASQVESLFENCELQVRVETESAGAARLTDSMRRIAVITSLICAVLLADLVIIVANSINMTVRERNHEMAILKVFGYSSTCTMGLVVGEAVVTGIVSGAIGAAVAYILAAPGWPWTLDVLSQFPLPVSVLLQGPLVGGAVSTAASVLPAWRTGRIRVTEAFHVG